MPPWWRPPKTFCGAGASRYCTVRTMRRARWGMIALVFFGTMINCFYRHTRSPIRATLAPPVVAWILIQFGWPAAFVAVGALGLVWLVLWWPVYYTPPEVRKEVAHSNVPVWHLMRDKFVWGFTLSKVFMD